MPSELIAWGCCPLPGFKNHIMKHSISFSRIHARCWLRTSVATGVCTPYHLRQRLSTLGGIVAQPRRIVVHPHNFDFFSTVPSTQQIIWGLGPGVVVSALGSIPGGRVGADGKVEIATKILRASSAANGCILNLRYGRARMTL